MMADTQYAWSTIRAGVGDSVKVVNVGDSVSASDLEVTDEEFQALIDSGAVRAQQFPTLPDNYLGSPIDYMKDAVRLLEESIQGVTGGFNESLLRQTMTGEVPEAPEVPQETAAPAPPADKVEL